MLIFFSNAAMNKQRICEYTLSIHLLLNASIEFFHFHTFSSDIFFVFLLKQQLYSHLCPTRLYLDGFFPFSRCLFYCLLCRISITNPVFHLYKFKPQIYSEPIRLKRLGLLLHHSNVDVTYKSIRRIHIVNIDFTRASVWDGIFGFRWWIFLSEFPISSWGVMHHC